MEQQPAQTPKVTVLTTEEIQEVDRLPTPISCLLGSKHTVFKTVAPVDDMQKLEANTLLIQAIQDQQNAGRLEQCLEYQEKLHKNLAELAALADVQQASTNQPR